MQRGFQGFYLRIDLGKVMRQSLANCLLALIIWQIGLDGLVDL